MPKNKNLILFLDIDGVLNTKNHLRRQIKQGKKASRFDWCPVAVAHVNLLTKKLGAQIIVTSTWRYEYSLDELKELFHQNGIHRDHVTGVIPSLIYGERSTTRGEAIQAWIEENESHNELHLILDDNDNGISERFPHFTQTSEKEGFADQEMIKRCLMIVNEKLSVG